MQLLEVLPVAGDIAFKIVVGTFGTCHQRGTCRVAGAAEPDRFQPAQDVGQVRVPIAQAEVCTLQLSELLNRRHQGECRLWDWRLIVQEHWQDQHPSPSQRQLDLLKYPVVGQVEASVTVFILLGEPSRPHEDEHRLRAFHALADPVGPGLAPIKAPPIKKDRTDLQLPFKLLEQPIRHILRVGDTIADEDERGIRGAGHVGVILPPGPLGRGADRGSPRTASNNKQLRRPANRPIPAFYEVTLC